MLSGPSWGSKQLWAARRPWTVTATPTLVHVLVDVVGMFTLRDHLRCKLMMLLKIVINITINSVIKLLYAEERRRISEA